MTKLLYNFLKGEKLIVKTNFQFLQKINKNLYEIITEAEKLYKDEYFEQCMIQTRRFGEQICKNILKQNNYTADTFDNMIEILKKNSNGSIQEKEFINDLYFQKKHGNQSVHSGQIKKDGITALECIKRAFEAAITYSVYNENAPENILKLNYDINILMTGKEDKSKNQQSLTARSEQEKEKNKKSSLPQKNETYKNDLSKTDISSFISLFFKKMIQRMSVFWKIVFIFSCISILLILVIIIGVIFS